MTDHKPDFHYAVVDDWSQCIECGALCVTYLKGGAFVHPKCYRSALDQQDAP